MIWYEKLKTFDFNHVKNIAYKCRTNKKIATELNITLGQLIYIRYNNYLINDKGIRELAVKFAIAIEEGKSEYKKNNLKKNLIQPY